MTILVVGATGTLGRQLVRFALDQGYSVKCLVRNIRKASFLREWGAELVYGDLRLPETLPSAFENISVVIDASTLRPDDEISKLEEVDLFGKLALIRSAQVAKVERFVFFSFPKNEFLSIALVRLKAKVVQVLKQSGLSYTIFYIPGFYQGLVSQYAIPILEQQDIWLTNDANPINYINSQDAANLCIKSLEFRDTEDKEFLLTGQKPWLSMEIIKLCEQLSGQVAKVRFVPLWLLRFIRNLAGFSKWGWQIQDRLSFSEVLGRSASSQNDSMNFIETYSKVLEDYDVLSLESYLQEYFERMLDKLRDLNYDQTQAMKRKDLTF